MTPPVHALLFDKDGTLFDFAATWDGWAADVLARLADGDPDLLARLADAWRFDLRTRRLRPDSPVVAGTEREAAQCLLPHLPHRSLATLCAELGDAAARITPQPAVPLAPLMGRLRAAGLRLGVMTNDGEAPARAHLDHAGILDAFDFVAGYDSGHGAKPDAAPLLAFADAIGIAPQNCAMVGDSRHDLVAARAAGMLGIGVLTGLADRSELAPFAALVLPDIGHLEHWLDLAKGDTTS